MSDEQRPQEERPKVKISESEQQAIRELEVTLTRAKSMLADFDLQIEMLNQQRMKVMQQVVDNTNAFQTAVKNVAAAHGIDGKPGSGKWNFDTSEMAFTMMAPPQRPLVMVPPPPQIITP